LQSSFLRSFDTALEAERTACERDEENIKHWKKEIWPSLFEKARSEERTIVFVDECGYKSIWESSVFGWQGVWGFHETANKKRCDSSVELSASADRIPGQTRSRAVAIMFKPISLCF
jgi:hypothetical protein